MAPDLFPFIPLLASWATIAALSVQVSATAILISSLIGIPLGTWLALHRFRGRQVITTLVYTGMGLPPVVVGLVVYLLLSRSGPLGVLDWLFTPLAMILAQAIISLPFVIGITKASVESVGSAVSEQLWTLGATSTQIARAVLWEARAGVIIAVMAGFGRVISEVGAVMLVGGNIEGKTRVLTTAIVLETRRGAFEQAVILGVVLLSIALVITATVLYLSQRTLRGRA